MTKFGRLAALSIVLVTGALVLDSCEPELPPYYAQPEPAPLQPYLGPPPAATPLAVVQHRTVRRHYVRHRFVRRHHRRQVRCRCVPTR